ncbi:response regulator [Bacillus sp. 3255]|uniref:response regulator n=1 Tax=Bacillus sp. 3255 TaxID=2817904 RepID=UPI00285C91FA|nr:response regulator [Bacillus sp. 3255]MDR6884607.1 two-component system response regulator YesN [Bacillus sp. 3255]
MWTVLLVEDEAFVRRSIRKGMPWEANGFKVIGECGNGQEALDFIRAYQPDLVICDIMMPVMNGVELLAQVREDQLGTSFIMLTVMNEFAYIQQAMELGASGYVLKLYLTPDKMSEALAKVKVELERSTRLMTKELDDYCEALYHVTPAQERTAAGPNQFDETFRPNMLLLILHGQADFDKKDLARLPVLDLEHASPGSRAHLYTKHGLTTVFLSMPEGIRPSLQTGEQRSCDAIVVVASGFKPDDLQQVWQGMLVRVTELWYGGRKGVYLYQPKVESPQGHASSNVPWLLEKNLIQAFEQRNQANLLHAWQEIWSWMAEAQLSVLRVKEFAMRLDRLFADLAGAPVSQTQVYAEAVSHEAAGLLFKHRIEMYVAYWKESSYEVTDHAEINKVIAYLNQHYEEDLPLSLLAGVAMMDDKYLSVLFKKKTGKTITEYLTGIRMEKACELLLQTDEPIALIGAKVGFSNENYFARIFRREVGKPPSVFRQQG